MPLLQIVIVLVVVDFCSGWSILHTRAGNDPADLECSGSDRGNFVATEHFRIIPLLLPNSNPIVQDDSRALYPTPLEIQHQYARFRHLFDRIAQSFATHA